VNTRAILISTTPGGHTENLTFRDITSDGLAGAVITVLGAEEKGSERTVKTFARNVTVENCTLERAMAAKYFRNDLVRGPVRMKADDDRYSELYFTTHESGGRYGNVTVRGNIFTSGPNAEHAITFAPGGDTILVADNIFSGPVRDIPPAAGCDNVILQGNQEAAPNALSAEIPAHTFQCQALGRMVEYSAYIPKGTPPAGGWPLVLLLHGDGRNHRTIADDTASRVLVLQQKFAIVFADGQRGWYIDSQADPASRYQSMLRELLDHVRHKLPVSSNVQSTGICGWSMGGYGAMRFAQTFPAEIGAVATSIALLDFPNPHLPKEENYPVSSLFGSDD
jgi:pimeloyl-ACP methyl ester carboxylesterase